MRRAVVVVVVLLLAACGRETIPAPVELSVTELDGLVQRIDGGSAHGSRARAAEDRVARCMAEAGFDYVAQVSARAAPSPEPLVLTRELAEARGYGETIPSVAGGAPGRWSDGSPAGLAQNEAYRAGLIAKELERYWSVLEGTLDGLDAGCRGEAMAATYPDVVVPEEFWAARDALRSTERYVETDPRVESAVARWATCMARAGQPGFSDRWDGARLVADRAASLEVPLGTSFAEVVERYGPELVELQAFERELALLDVGCLETAGFYAAWEEVRLEEHAATLEAHRAELEAWATWAETVRRGAP